MNVDISTEITIKRGRAEVAAYATEPDNATSWYRNIKSVEWHTPPPVQVGSHFAFVAEFLGRRLAYTYEVREMVPRHRLVMSTTDGPFAMETTYTWSDTDDGTRMTLRNRGRPAGFSRLVTPFMAAAIRRANRQDLLQLKGILESVGWAGLAAPVALRSSFQTLAAGCEDGPGPEYPDRDEEYPYRLAMLIPWRL